MGTAMIMTYSVYALIALLVGASLWMGFNRWREQRLYKVHRQDNIDAEREWHAKHGKPSAKPQSDAEA